MCEPSAEQLHLAQHAFTACVDANLNPSLEAETFPFEGNAEYAVVVGRRGMRGLIHEEIDAILRIAAEHEGRAWLHEGTLAIVWPITDPPGPIGEPSSAEAEAERARTRKPRRKGASAS